jgi:hypothetical protein
LLSCPEKADVGGSIPSLTSIPLHNLEQFKSCGKILVMPPSEEVASRKANLAAELKDTSTRTFNNARRAYLFSQLLFILALGASAGAAVGGVFFNVSSKVVGGLAALPPLIGFVAINLKLEARSSWHYRKCDAMNELHSQLMYQQPEEPTVENIASVAKRRDEVLKTMRKEWEDKITANWLAMLRHRPTSVGNE